MEVRQEHGTPTGVVGNFRSANESQPVVAGQHGHNENETSCRQDASGPASIEIPETERIRGLDLPEQYASDHEARNDVEDIDADKPAGESRDLRVKQNDGDHRNGPQSLDIRSVLPITEKRACVVFRCWRLTARRVLRSCFHAAALSTM